MPYMVNIQWCSSRDLSLRLKTSRDLVLMSWSRSWTPQALVLGPRVWNHVRNYDFSEKGLFSPKNLIFGVFCGYTCGPTIFFLLFVAIETSRKNLRMNVLVAYCLGLELKSWSWLFES